MAEVISRTSLFSGTCKYDHKRNQHIIISVLPRISGGFGSKKRFSSLKLKSQSLRSDFHGNRIILRDNKGDSFRRNLQSSIIAQAALRIGSVQKWWEKGLQPNMREIVSAQDLVDSLLNAGDKLVVVDFFSPGCGGCKALHPKICQLAEMNPDVQFLQVNYEEHKSMCYSLGVHVLPFFRFYRGAHGRLCSFSCTNATIKKFKDALAKHTPDRCSRMPTKGLEEKELIALAANKDLNFTYNPKPPTEPELVPAHKDLDVAETTASNSNSNSNPLLQIALPSTYENRKEAEEMNLVTAGR